MKARAKVIHWEGKIQFHVHARTEEWTPRFAENDTVHKRNSLLFQVADVTTSSGSTAKDTFMSPNALIGERKSLGKAISETTPDCSWEKSRSSFRRWTGGSFPGGGGAGGRGARQGRRLARGPMRPREALSGSHPSFGGNIFAKQLSKSRLQLNLAPVAHTHKQSVSCYSASESGIKVLATSLKHLIA